jgi:hypothetical protein
VICCLRGSPNPRSSKLESAGPGPYMVLIWVLGVGNQQLVWASWQCCLCCLPPVKMR